MADVLVGRDTEIAVLDSLVSQAVAGAEGVLLLCGEPGVGKTRLAREISGRAGGVVVSWGACGECEGAPPLWPWIQVLRWLGGRTSTAGATDTSTAGAADGPPTSWW